MEGEWVGVVAALPFHGVLGFLEGLGVDCPKLAQESVKGFVVG